MRSGSTVDAKREFGWKDDRMADRYDHVRPADERLARPSPFRGFRGGRKQEVFSAKRTPYETHMRVSCRQPQRVVGYTPVSQ